MTETPIAQTPITHSFSILCAASTRLILRGTCSSFVWKRVLRSSYSDFLSSSDAAGQSRNQCRPWHFRHPSRGGGRGSLGGAAPPPFCRSGLVGVLFEETSGTFTPIDLGVAFPEAPPECCDSCLGGFEFGLVSLRLEWTRSKAFARWTTNA